MLTADDRTLGLYRFDEDQLPIMLDQSEAAAHGQLEDGSLDLAIDSLRRQTRGGLWFSREDLTALTDGDGQNGCYVDVPLELAPEQSRTIEAIVVTRRVPPPKTNVSQYVVTLAGNLALKQYNEIFTFFPWPEVYPFEPMPPTRRRSVRPGQRLYLAATTDAAAVQCFVDGERECGYRITDNASFARPLQIGSRGELDLTTAYPFSGVIEQVRISDGVREPKSDAVPDSLEADEQTIALYDFRRDFTGERRAEAAGNESTPIADVSGNGHDATLWNGSWLGPLTSSAATD